MPFWCMACACDRGYHVRCQQQHHYLHSLACILAYILVRMQTTHGKHSRPWTWRVRRHIHTPSHCPPCSNQFYTCTPAWHDPRQNPPAFVLLTALPPCLHPCSWIRVAIFHVFPARFEVQSAPRKTCMSFPLRTFFPFFHLFWSPLLFNVGPYIPTWRSLWPDRINGLHGASWHLNCT